MLKNFKLVIEYDGTAFHGWQRQKSDRTIQGEIESAILKMTDSDSVTLTGSGRTDAGVHALGQIANFKCHTTHTAEIFKNGLNSLLPDGIVVKACDEVDQSFHARYDVKNKTYIYRILNISTPPAIGRQYAWFVKKKLNLGEMRKGAKLLVGTHDFKAFEGSGSPRSSTVRQVIKAEFSERKHGYILFEIKANGFLRYMVRNIVGTLVNIGLNKLTPLGLKAILESRDRNLAGATAPAHGLFLKKVNY